MKNKYWLYVLCVMTAGTSSRTFAQHSYYGSLVLPPDPSPYRMILTINPQDGAYLKKDFGSVNEATQINGETVQGTPFFLDTWVNGELTTMDGRTYNLPFRYNAYRQIVNFVNGKDTLEVTDAIKQFNLYAQAGDTALLLQFVNASQYKKQNKTFYYQVILDNEKGQLLKTNQKTIRSLTEGLLAAKGKKYFDVSSDYFYYDKTTKKITKINPDGSNLKTILKPDANTTGDYNFSDEDDLIRFFRNYFQNKKPETF